MQKLFRSLLRIALILKQQIRVPGSCKIRVVPKAAIINFLLRSIVLVAPICFVRSEGSAIMTTGQNLVLCAILIFGWIFVFRFLCIRLIRAFYFFKKICCSIYIYIYINIFFAIIYAYTLFLG